MRLLLRRPLRVRPGGLLQSVVQHPTAALIAHAGAGLALCAALLPTHAQGVDVASLDGSWTARFATESSDRGEAQIMLKDGAGTWTMRPRGDKDERDACAGRPLPLSVAMRPSETLMLQVAAAHGVAGCRGRQARLTVVDGKTLEGEFDNGRVLRLVRD